MKLFDWPSILAGLLRDIWSLVRSLLPYSILGGGSEPEIRLPRERPRREPPPAKAPAPGPPAPEPPTAASSPAPPSDATGSYLSRPGGSVPVDVFYATDRAREGDGYSGHPNATHRVALGRATISIPANHRRGSLERPFSLFRKELFAEDPQKHVVIHAGPTEMEEAAYYAAVREAIANSTQRDAFVFVHGYNVSFADALRRTGQLAYDVGWKGAPILYSWPSRGELMGYTSDEQIVDYSAPHLADFLTQLREHAAMERLHLIAHSMGSRVLTKALDRIHLAGGKAALQAFQEVIIAAPDLNLHVFSELAGALRETSRHVTIYSSTRDLALRISSALHGEAARVGSGQDLPARARGFDLIDAANVDTSFLGHSYFVEQPALLEDLRDVLLYGKPAAERAGRLRPAGLIWEFF